MTCIIDDELNLLIKQKHDLIRQFDRKEVEEGEYKMRLGALVEKIKEKTRIIFEKNDEQLRIENEENERLERERKDNVEEVDEKMVDEEIKGGKPLSYTKLIIRALTIKGVKNIDDAVAKVLEWKPGRDAKKVKTQIKSIMYLVKTKKGAKRWNNYEWDDENFLLIPKNDS